MERFDLHILGCGSALPTLRHLPTSQVLNIHEKLYMIDCGEGTQRQLRRTRLPFSRLNHIFISHLHGDHCFGLLGLISTFSLLGRTSALHVYAPEELEQLLAPLLAFHCQGANFAVVFHPFPTQQSELIYEDKTITVHTLPLRHRLPCCGFLFRERPTLPHIRRDMIDYLGIPLHAINDIKHGASWTREDGTVVPNDRLVTPSAPPRSYAYLSDTAPCPQHAERLHGIDLLFHEATFANTEKARAAETFHSTAEQAAQMAQLAEARQLIIGHFSSRYDNEEPLLQESRALFPQTILAQEGLTVAVGPRRK